MLLALDPHLAQGFRDEIACRLEKASLNPLENDLAVEVEIAHRQYKNLIEYAKRPDGLPAKLDRDRREEMVRLAPNGKGRAGFPSSHVISLGFSSNP